MPSLLLMYVSAALRADPDVAPLLDATDEERNDVRQRLQELIRAEREREDRRPSLRRFLAHQLDLSRATKKSSEFGPDRGFPFRALYERGERFSWGIDEDEYFDTDWLKGYFAYRYYRLHKRLTTLGRALWLLIRQVVTGAP